MTWAPSARSSAVSSSAPGVSAPRRPVSSRCSAPAVASQRATCPPRAPRPPVTRTVPPGCHGRAGAGPGRSAWARRRQWTPDGRRATWSSPGSPVRTARRRCAAWSSRTAGRSTRPAQRSGYSTPAAPPRPHRAACAGAVTGSAGPTETAPRVAAHSGASIPASPRAPSRATVIGRAAGSTVSSDQGRSVSPSRESTPAGSCPSAAARSRAAPVVRSSAASHGTTRGVRPCRRRASRWAVTSVPSGVTTSQSPVARRDGRSCRTRHSTR